MEKELALEYVMGGNLFKRVDGFERLCVFVCGEEVYENFEPEQDLDQVHDLAQNLEGLESKSDAKQVSV